jgi:hypothetical protein
MAAEATVVVVVDRKSSGPGWITGANDRLATLATDAVGLASVSAFSLILRECSKMSWVMMASIRANNHI